MKDFFDKITDFIHSSGWRIVAFFAVLLFGIIIIRCIAKLLRKIIARGPLNKSLGGFLCTVIKFFLYLILILVLASIAGMDLQPLTTILLSAGLAISLALQDSLSNVANGMIIVATKPFVVGDFIEVAGEFGTVRKIGMIFTELITIDNRKISIPNTKITSDSIINASSRPTRRVEMKISVSRDSDLDLVKETLYSTMAAHPSTLDEPQSMVRMIGYGESSFDFTARVWVNTVDYWETYWELTEQIVRNFREKGIKMPYRTVDINMDKPSPAGDAEKTNEEDTL